MPSKEASVNAVSPLMELFSLECFEIEHSSAAAISLDMEGCCDFFEYLQPRELPLKIHMAVHVRENVWCVGGEERFVTSKLFRDWVCSAFLF